MKNKQNQSVFYVAKLYKIFNPTIVAKLASKEDAQTYINLISKTDDIKSNYIILEQIL
jgi:hypothetical protein